MVQHHRQINRSVRNCFSILAVVARLALGCLFVWGSLSKIQLPHSFLGDVYGYQIAGPVAGMFITMSLPWLELVVGICLLSGVFVTGALLACIGMSVTFMVAVGWALYQGLDISCGCFGHSGVLINYGTLIRIIIMLVVSGFAYCVELFVVPYVDKTLSVSRHKTDDRDVGIENLASSIVPQAN